MAKVIASYKHNLNRLSREEYEELQHECGKAAPQWATSGSGCHVRKKSPLFLIQLSFIWPETVFKNFWDGFFTVMVFTVLVIV